MVQDPNFWRRFSIAVHNDEAAILAADAESGSKGKRETKHAYVVSLTSPIDSPSSICTPTSQCHLSPAFPPAAFTRPLSAPASAALPPAPQNQEARKSAATSGSRSVYFDAPEEKTAEEIALRELPSCPSHPSLARRSSLGTSVPTTPKSAHFALPSTASTPRSKTTRFSRRASRFRFALSSHPPSLPATPTFPRSSSFPSPDSPSLPPAQGPSKRSSRFTSHKAPSRLSLGISLSGRPKSAFKFWTTIEADPAACRDSWLEGQQRKARQRAYMCWAFWGVFLMVVVGVVVAVLVLKGKGII
ncbi:hypothetical protein SVAN01_03309 [Stagonosporopsis vannaccii]|nr:hypothetical protein SVAN01_03309 [Stagonosporopsis vannaccii]